MTRTRVLAALLAALTLAGIGTAAGALGSDDGAAPTPVTVVAQTRTTSTTATPTSTSTPAADVRSAPALTADEAAARAVAHLGGGTAVKIESETEHGRATWKVDVRRSTGVSEVYVEAASGAVTRTDGERSDDRGRDDRGRDDRGRHGGDDRSDDHGGRHGGDDRSDDH